MLAKFVAASGEDKRLILRCLVALALTRLGLWVLTYRALRRLMPADAVGHAAGADQTSKIVWGVERAAGVIPRATCLTQVMAAQFLLARAGHPTQVRIGVARDPAGRFLAHAWLVSESRVLIGGTAREIERYTHLADLDATLP